jgi:hypothetical protein
MTSKLIIISILFALTTSCKKERMCFCSHPRIDGGYSETYKDTKKSATSKCTDLDKKWKEKDPEYSCQLVE